jgi:pyruvate kinase
MVVNTATQRLVSMINSPEPTGAAVADVANAVIDGTSAVMLSAETGVGSYPVEAVRAMAEIAEEAERAPEIHGRARNPAFESAGGAVMHAAIELALELDAVALVVPTATGGAPRACAKYRVRRPIIAVAHDRRVADQLTLEWGVVPTLAGTAENVDEMIDQALMTARDAGGVPSGATVVLTAGRRTGTPGATNLIMVREIP